jgi:hypothetical protein
MEAAKKYGWRAHPADFWTRLLRWYPQYLKDKHGMPEGAAAERVVALESRLAAVQPEKHIAGTPQDNTDVDFDFKTGRLDAQKVVVTARSHAQPRKILWGVDVLTGGFIAEEVGTIFSAGVQLYWAMPDSRPFQRESLGPFPASEGIAWGLRVRFGLTLLSMGDISASGTGGMAGVFIARFTDEGDRTTGNGFFVGGEGFTLVVEEIEATTMGPAFGYERFDFNPGAETYQKYTFSAMPSEDSFSFSFGYTYFF